MELGSEAYRVNAESSMSKSSSGVQEVEETRSFVAPEMMEGVVSSGLGRIRVKISVREAGSEVRGWKIAAGRSCTVVSGVVMLYGGEESWRAMAWVTVRLCEPKRPK